MGVNAALRQQRIRFPLLCHRAAGEHHDLVGSGYRAHPVGDDQHGFLLDQAGEGVLDQRLIFHIERSSGLVQQNDGRVLRKARAMEMR